MTLQRNSPDIARDDWFWIQIEDVTGEHALQVRVWQDKHVWEVVKKWCAAHKEHPADWRFEYRTQEISPTDEMGLPSTQTIQSLVIPLVPSPACAIKCIPLAEPEDPDPMEEREQYSIVKLVHTYLAPLPMTFCSTTTLEQILLKYCQVMDFDDQRIKVKFDRKEVRNCDKTLEEIGVEDGDVLEVL